MLSYIGANDLRSENIAVLAKKREILIKGWGSTTYTDENWDILAEVVRTTTTLEKLFFGATAIALQNDKVVEAIAKNRTIKTLDLWRADCGDEGAKAVAAILKENSTIEVVDLRHNDIGVEGAKAIADALKHNKALRIINLSNDICFKQHTYDQGQGISLNCNSIANEGAKAIAEALKENASLQTLYIERNSIGEEGGKYILNALQQIERSAIENIYLGGDDKVSDETRAKIRQEIIRIKRGFKSAASHEGQVVSNTTAAGGSHGAQKKRSSNGDEGMPTIHAPNVSQGSAENVQETIRTGHNSYIDANDLRRDNVALLLKKKEIQVKGGWHAAYTYTDESSFTDESWDILAKVIGTTTSLEKLAFSGDNAVAALQNDKVVDALAKNRTIKTLDLFLTVCGDMGAKAVAAILEANSTIQIIKLSKNDIGGEGAKVIAGVLKHNKTVTHIDLSNNRIGTEGAKAIANTLKENTSLESINLGGNNIRNNGAKAIGKALKKNTSLQTVDLEASEIGDEGATTIAEALEGNHSIQTLRLSGNPIGTAGTKAIAEALKKNKSLQTLMFSGNQIGVEGAKAIAEALKENAYLTTVDLHENDIGNEGGKAIVDALERSKTLRHVDLCANKISEEVAKAIVDALKVNESLQTLRLRGNHIGDEGAKAVAVLLKENTPFQKLDIGGNNIGEEGGIFILNALQQIESSAIDVVDLSMNTISEEIIKKIDQEITRIRSNFSPRKIEELKSTITQLQSKIAEQDKELASTKDILKTICNLANGKDGGVTSNTESSMRDRETELQSENERYKEENASLKEQLKNSRPIIETVDLTNKIDPGSSSGGEDSNEEEPPSKRRRMKSNLAFALEQTQKMVKVKEEAKERAAVAEANVAVARREKDAAEASLRDVEEDLEDSEELVFQQTLTTNIWQGRFDELFELAEAAGVDGSLLSEIRNRPTASRR